MALAFFALPLSFIGFELIALRHAVADEIDVREKEVLLSSLRALKDHHQLLPLCADWLTASFRTIVRTPEPRRHIAALQQQVQKVFGLTMEFIVFTPSGVIDTDLSTIQIPATVSLYLGSDLARLDSTDPGRENRFNKRLPEYQEFFGPWAYRLAEDRHLVGLHQVRADNRRNTLYVSPQTASGRLLALIDIPQNLETYQLNWVLRQRLSAQPRERGALLSADWTRSDLERQLGEGGETGWQASLLMGSTCRQAMRVGDWLWAQYPIDQHSRLFLGRPDDSRAQLEQYRDRLILVLCALVLGAAVVFVRLQSATGRWAPRLSIRLFLLLSYTVGLPLLVFGLSARTLQRDLDEVYQRLVHSRHVAIIRELDRRYLDYLGYLEETLRSRFRLTSDGPGAEEELKQRMRQIGSDLRPVSAVYIDPTGTARSEYGHENFSLPPALKKLVFTACASVIGTQEKATDRVADELTATVIDEYGVNVDMVVSIVTEHPETLIDFGFFSTNIALLLNPVFLNNGATPFAALTAWDTDIVRWQFLQSHLERLQANLADTEIAVQNLTQAGGHLPADSVLQKAPSDILQSFTETRRPVTVPVTLASQTWLLTGTRGSQLKNVLCIAGSSPERRRGEAGQFHRRVLTIGGLLALFGLLIARILSITFLGPIRALAEGVDALAAVGVDLTVAEGEVQDAAGSVGREVHAVRGALRNRARGT
ncbi:MAG TPA: hypothetical protein PKO06_16970, partial [Candidatus Ozemobacteraceae bacterium]|nr:hypothetical protein [Candidatus Ozemobacteraceae bacterium]